MELPLHFRYQPPSSKSPYKTISIPTPMAFVVTNQLPKQFQQESTIKLPCKASSKDRQPCIWTRVQVDAVKKEREGLELTADIPRGLQDHTTIVVGLTVFTTLMATAYIAYAFMSVRERTEKRKKNQ